MSQAELAKALSVSQTGVSGWERGYRQPDFDTLRLIAKYFDVSSDYLLGLNDWK